MPRRCALVVCTVTATIGCGLVDSGTAQDAGPGSMPGDATVSPDAEPSDAEASDGAPLDARGGDAPDDGGASDAPMDGTSTRDSQPPPPPTGCAAHNYFFCEDFEGTPPNGWTNGDANGGTSTIDTQRPHWGTRSLHGTTGAGDQERAVLYRTLNVPAKFRTRLFLYRPSPAAPEPEAFLNIQQGPPNYRGLQLYHATDTLSYVDYFVSPNVNAMGGSTSTDAWHCFEWALDTAAGTSDVWVDGAIQTGLARKGDTMSALSLFVLGIGFDGATAGTRELWIDDVVVDPNPIGCSP